MSNKKAEIINQQRYLASVFSEKSGFIESEGFQTKKARSEWVKDELKDLTECEKIYAKEENRKKCSYFALFYDYSGIESK